MHIGLTTSVIQRGHTGVGQYVLNLVRALMSHTARHEFTLFVLEDDAQLFDFASGAMRIVRVEEKYRAPVQDIWWHQSSLPGLARRHGLDLIHVPSHRRLVGHAPCAKVGTIHDLAPFRLAGRYDWKRMLYVRTVARAFAHRQDAIIAVSDATAADVRRFFGIDRSRLVTIRNGIDHTRFTPSGAADAMGRVAQRWVLNLPYFLYISRLEHPAKNHVRLIAAYEQFRRESGAASPLVLGGSDWHGADIIRQRAAQSPYAADIQFLGFVPEQELPALYQAAIAMVYPSHFEGFGFPPVEAMASGCPVICSARGALAEVVGDAARIINPEDENDIAQSLAELARDTELRSRLRHCGLEHSNGFSWETTANLTLAVYQEAIARHRAGSPALAEARSVAG